MVGSSYEIKVVSLSAAELASPESAVIQFSVPKPALDEPEKTTPVQVNPEVKRKAAKSYSLVLNPKGRVLNRTHEMNDFTRGLKKGTRVTCTIYLADSRYSTNLARSVLRFAIRECEEIRKSVKGISTWSKYASFSSASRNLKLPRKNQYLIHVVRP